MKLSEIFSVGEFPEYSQEEIDDAIKYLQSGNTLTQLEGGKFSLLQKENTYALVRNRDNEILGWIVLEPHTVANITGLVLKTIYVQPKFRKSVAASIMVFSIKQYLNKPIIVDGPVSEPGQQLLQAISSRPRYFVVKYVNAVTGVETPYASDMLQPHDKEHIIIVEQRDQISSNIHEDVMPGGHVRKIILSFFSEDDHNGLMQ